MSASTMELIGQLIQHIGRANLLGRIDPTLYALIGYGAVIYAMHTCLPKNAINARLTLLGGATVLFSVASVLAYSMPSNHSPATIEMPAKQEIGHHSRGADPWHLRQTRTLRQSVQTVTPPDTSAPPPGPEMPACSAPIAPLGDHLPVGETNNFTSVKDDVDQSTLIELSDMELS